MLGIYILFCYRSKLYVGNLESIVFRGLNKHAPIQNKKIRLKNVPWITRRIKKLILSRDKLKRKAIIANLETDWCNYKQIRNKVNAN